MATPATIKCLEERQVDRPITSLLWSPRMDIIAVGSANNDLSLYRLNWQRIWITDASEDKCQALSWRPDGKVLAIGYDTGKLDLFDVESHVPVISNSVDEPITFLRWSSCSLHKNEHNDTDWEFLTKFPSLSKAFSYNPSNHEDIQNCRKLSVESSPSLLICGTAKGSIHFFMAGYLYIGSIDIQKIFGFGEDVVREVIFAPQNLSSLVVLSSNEESFHLSVVRFPMIAACFSQLYTLAEKQSILQGTMDYMEDTLKQISEAWEIILLEMDHKLSSYSKQMPDEHGMSADFLELLILGVPSPELEHFLLQELGEKGLKKLGHSIEVSYSNVQRLVLKYLHTVSQALNFHLAEMMGDIQASDKYESVIKISTKAISRAQKNASAFWAKGLELQQVIDESMKCFKAFFRWLYVEILRLSDENVSEDLSKASQQDVEFIAEFLDNFSNKAKDNESGTYLERVGQYMKDEPLVQLVDRTKNPWHNFLRENPDLADIPEILVVDENASLIQSFHRLQASISDIFADLQSDFSDTAVPIGSFQIKHPDMKSCHFSQMEQCDSQDRTHGIVLWSGQGPESKAFCFDFDSARAKNPIKGLWVSGGALEGENAYHIMGGSFYTSDTISVLLENNEGQRLIQLPVASISPYYKDLPSSDLNTICIDHGAILDTQSIFSLAGPACHRELEGLNADEFSVSGPRKVAAFLFKNKKRIRIYDMEIEEEDDDEGDTLGNSGFSSELNTSF